MWFWIAFGEGMDVARGSVGHKHALCGTSAHGWQVDSCDWTKMAVTNNFGVHCEMACIIFQSQNKENNSLESDNNNTEFSPIHFVYECGWQQTKANYGQVLKRKTQYNMVKTKGDIRHEKNYFDLKGWLTSVSKIQTLSKMAALSTSGWGTDLEGTIWSKSKAVLTYVLRISKQTVSRTDEQLILPLKHW
jgi:hypothetical protein